MPLAPQGERSDRPEAGHCPRSCPAPASGPGLVLWPFMHVPPSRVRVPGYVPGSAPAATTAATRHSPARSLRGHTAAGHPASSSSSGSGQRVRPGKVAGPQVGEVSPAAWSPPPFLELGGGCPMDDERGDALPGRGPLCLGLATAASVHLPRRLIAVTDLGLGQFSRGDRLGRRHSSASGSGSGSQVPRAELTEVGMAQATTAHCDWLDEGKPEAPLAGGLPIVQLTACRRGGHRALPVPMLWW
jgi:hypothetical protein